MMDHDPSLSAALGAAVGDHFRAFVAAQVATGHYRDAADVLRAALRLLENAEASGPGLTAAEIRALVEEGDASGESEEDPDAFFDRLEAKYAAMPEGQRRGA